jgi:hypothetical protein
MSRSVDTEDDFDDGELPYYGEDMDWAPDEDEDEDGNKLTNPPVMKLTTAILIR